jgi:hypothetical protein
MVDLKKTTGKLAKDALLNEAAKQVKQPIINDLLDVKPVIGSKAKVAGILGVIAAVVGAASQYLGN